MANADNPRELTGDQIREVRETCELINGLHCDFPACDCTPPIPPPRPATDGAST
jgi:hypothetical protein